MPLPTSKLTAALLATVLGGGALAVWAQAGVERKVLVRQDLPVAGYEAVLAEVTIPAGGREGKHTHAGTLVGRIVEGELLLEVAGAAPQLLKTGDPFVVEAGRVHEGINRGSVPAKALASFFLEKGKPLATAVP